MSDSYVLPPVGTKSDDRLSWLKEAVSESEDLIRANAPLDEIRLVLDIVSGRIDARVPKSTLKLKLNYLKRQAREMIATLSNLRPMWGYHTDNRDYEAQAVILDRLLRGWWTSTFADRKIRKALQYSAFQGVGYISPIWSKDYWTQGRGDVELNVYGLFNVLPIQLGPDGNLQNAYGVIIRVEVPVNQARALYPAFADKIFPTRDRPSWYSRAMGAMNRFMRSGTPTSLARRDTERSSGPTVDLHYAYILDTSINVSGRLQPMGDPGTSWYYEVPSLGSKTSHGIATEEDARLYPNRRLVIFTDSCLISDGPSPWWHGKVPVVPFHLDDWPWAPFGYPIAADVSTIQLTNVEFIRAMVDSANLRLDPPSFYDKHQISPKLAEVLNLRRAGARIPGDPARGAPLSPLFDPKFYDPPQWIPQMIENLWALGDKLLGLNDTLALAKSRSQMPAADTIERILEVAGPIATDQSRSMEAGLLELGEMYKSLVFQFYTKRRRVQLLGLDGLTVEDYDFEPDSLVPSHLPGEDQLEIEGSPSKYDRFHRAKWHQNNIHFQVTPASLHQITQTGRKLLLLQLQRSGFPVDPWTLAEAFDVPNFGSPPADTRNVLDRWIAWNKIQVQVAMEAQQMMGASQAMSALGMTSPTNPEGRPPTAQTAPHLEVKDGGTRTTIAESN